MRDFYIITTTLCAFLDYTLFLRYSFSFSLSTIAFAFIFAASTIAFAFSLAAPTISLEFFLPIDFSFALSRIYFAFILAASRIAFAFVLAASMFIYYIYIIKNNYFLVFGFSLFKKDGKNDFFVLVSSVCTVAVCWFFE